MSRTAFCFTSRPVRLGLLLIAVFVAGCGAPDRPSISLYLAVQRGDIDQLERHIYWGSDLNALDRDGNRPLHVLAERGNIVAVKQLLKAGVEINATDRDGRSALLRALLSGRTQLASILEERGAEFDSSTLLLEIARNQVRDRDVISWLVDRGADLERPATDGNTALIIAIRKRDHRLARHLIAQGANVNTAGESGQRPLDIAEEMQQPELAALLRRYGAVDSDTD